MNKKIVSSVLVEAGYALALNKRSIYFVKNYEDLPYLLKVAAKQKDNVEYYVYSEIDEIINKLTLIFK